MSGIDYNKIFSLCGKPNNKFYGYSDHERIIINECTPGKALFIERMRRTAQSKEAEGKAPHRGIVKGNGAIPPAMLVECEGPQTMEEWRVTVFCTPKVGEMAYQILAAREKDRLAADRAAYMAQMTGQSAQPEPEPVAPKVEGFIPNRQPTEPVKVATQPEPEPEQEIDLFSLSRKELNQYAIDAGIDEAEVNKQTSKAKLINLIENK